MLNLDDYNKIDLGNITTEETPKVKRGRKPGNHYLKPMDMGSFLQAMDCLHISAEHPYIEGLTLVENPYLRNSFARVFFKRGTIELASKTLLKPRSQQREVFIKALCHFIAIKLFNRLGREEAYRLLVLRYNRNTKPSAASKTRIIIQEENKISLSH